MMTTLLIVLSVAIVLILLGAILLLAYLLRASWVNEMDLRRENERLLARIGWEYHIQTDRPSPGPSDIPDVPVPMSRLFRMKPDPRFMGPDATIPNFHEVNSAR